MAPVLTLILLLTLVGSGVYAWNLHNRNRPAPDRDRPRALPSGPRGPGQLRTHDVVSTFGRDWLVEGVVQLEDSPARPRLARLVDGNDVRWLLADGEELVMLEPGKGDAPPLPPPDPLHTAGATFRLSASGGGRVARHGDVGPRAAERCRFWLYSGPGARRAWLDEFKSPELLVGEVVPETMLEVFPGS